MYIFLICTTIRDIEELFFITHTICAPWFSCNYWYVKMHKMYFKIDNTDESIQDIDVAYVTVMCNK